MQRESPMQCNRQFSGLPPLLWIDVQRCSLNFLDLIIFLIIFVPSLPSSKNLSLFLSNSDHEKEREVKPCKNSHTQETKFFQKSGIL